LDVLCQFPKGLVEQRYNRIFALADGGTNFGLTGQVQRFHPFIFTLLL
jgi:hypothetical protein